MFNEKYHVYIITNVSKTVLYTGVTNNLQRRLTEHFLNRGKLNSFAGQYNCFYLLYYESFKYVIDAIDREKKIKSWSRKKKEILITEDNSEWKFLNSTIMKWPPDEQIKLEKDGQFLNAGFGIL